MFRITTILVVLLVALAMTACGGASFVASDTGDYRYSQHGVSALPPAAKAEGKYIVVLKRDTSDVARAANEIATAHGAAPGLVYSHALKGFSATMSPRAAAAMANNPRVDYIEPDITLFAVAKPPSPPGKPPPPPPDTPDEVLPWGIDRIDAELNTGPKGAGVAVAVLDTGIDTDHPDLAANYKGGYDFVNGDALPEDDNGHGTHVSGIIAAAENTVGVVGVAPNAGIVAVKVLNRRGSGSISTIIAGIDWVVANGSSYGIKVANFSLGAYGTSTALHAAIQGLYSSGVTITAAAGNESLNAYNFIPAAYPEVLCVSAMDSADKFAYFSNYGDVVDLIAPGAVIKSTYLKGGYRDLSGTSMASPHVAGAAALYLDDHSGTPAQVMQALIAAGEAPPWPDGLWPGDPDGIGEPLVDAESL